MLRKGTFILMKTKIQDMTSGSPGRLIILFAIPLMLGNICMGQRISKICVNLWLTVTG